MVQYELVIDDGDDGRGTMTITVMISQTRTVHRKIYQKRSSRTIVMTFL